MRYGGDTLKTLKGVHERVELHPHEPPAAARHGHRALLRSRRLVQLTTHTVIENLLVGMVLVTLVLWLFLGTRARRCITALNIPLALLVAFIGMVATGTPANLISLGAVDFGIVVDSTVIMMENIFRHLRRRRERIDARAHRRGGAARSARRCSSRR